jgi:hypothetical protein
MNRMPQLLSAGVASCALLIASTLPTAAQPGGPCALAPDAVLAKALGPSAHGIQGLTAPDLESCGVAAAGKPNISIFHITIGSDPEDLTAPIGPTQDAGADQPAQVVQVTPVDGFGDQAVFIAIPVGDAGTVISLRVQRGAEIYAFNTRDAPEAQATLMEVGRAVLDNLSVQ